MEFELLEHPADIGFRAEAGYEHRYCGSYNLRVAVTNSKIYKVAGLSLLRFCAVSIGVDRANVGPIASQVAGFCGAFLGALVAQRRQRSNVQLSQDELSKANKNLGGSG